MSAPAAAIAAAQAILSTAAVVSCGAFARLSAVLSPVGAGELSALGVLLLEPCLAFSALSRLTSSDLAAGGPMLLWAPLHSLVALGLGVCLLPKSPRKGAALACAAFGNAGLLPIALVPALVASPSVSAQGLLFVQVYLVPFRLLVWGLGPALLTLDRPKKTDGRQGSPGNGARSSIASWLRMLLPPPSVGSLLGIALAFAPGAVRSACTSGNLAWALTAIRQVGSAQSPLALMALGFALAGSAADAHGAGQKGQKGKPSATRFTAREIATVCLIRLMLLPLIHRALCAVLHPTPASSGLLADPFALVLLLQACVPTSVSLTPVFQREGIDTRQLGPMMLVQYLLAMPAIVAHVAMAS